MHSMMYVALHDVILALTLLYCSNCTNCILVPDPPVDLPRVEPYAVSRWTPDEVGLYARADLFASGK